MTESFRRNRRETIEKEQRESIKDPLTGETMDIGEYDKTLPQVLQDAEGQRRFFSFLGGKDAVKAAAIADAYAKGSSWTPAQETFVSDSLREFNRRRAELGRVEQTFTPEYLRNIADASPQISAIVNMVGIDSAHEVLLKKFENIGYEHPAAFSRMLNAMISAKNIATGDLARGADHRASEALRKIGTDESEIGSLTIKSMGMTAGFDASEKVAIQKEARKHMGVLMKVADVVSGSRFSHNRAKAFIGAFEDQRKLFSDSNIQLADIGRSLNATVTPELRLEMRRMAVEGGAMKELPETNINTMQEMKSAHEDLSDAARKKRLTTAVEKESRRLGKKLPSTWSPAERDNFLESYASSEMNLQSTKKGSGIFATLLSVLFKNKADIKTRAASLLP